MAEQKVTTIAGKRTGSTIEGMVAFNGVFNSVFTGKNEVETIDLIADLLKGDVGLGDQFVVTINVQS